MNEMTGRQIKFRVWFTDDKEMLYDDGYIHMSGTFIGVHMAGDIDAWVDWDNYILMQYTGLKDKNGKEIYEGDIIKAKDVIGEVKFGEYHQIGTSPNLRYGYYFRDCYGLLPSDIKPFNVEVIGNIHKNPELLKEIVA